MSYGTPKASTSISESMGSSGVSSGIYGGGSSESSSSGSLICTEQTEICVRYTLDPFGSANLTLTGSLNGGSFTANTSPDDDDAQITVTWNDALQVWEVTTDLGGEENTEGPLLGGDVRCDPVGAVFEHTGESIHWTIEVLSFGACCECDPDSTTCYVEFISDGEPPVYFTLTGSLCSGLFDFEDVGLRWEEGGWIFEVAAEDSTSAVGTRCDPTGDYTGSGWIASVALTP